MFKSCRVLFCYHGLGRFYRPPPLSPRMTVCGPFVDEQPPILGVDYVKTGFGRFDLAQVVDELPEDKKPDVIFVRIDASGSVLPTGLSRLAAPVVVVVGDTHHMDRPIRTIVQYLREEPCQFVVTYNNRHHAHFLQESGIAPILWVPGITVTPSERSWQPEREPTVTFVGNVIAAHRSRAQLIEAFRASGLAFEAKRATSAEAARLYSTGAVSLNCSLNGDLNMRVFEVLSAGGLLLTDRLHSLAGLDDLLVEGQHYFAYRSAEEAVELSRKLLADPQLVARVSYEGHKRYHHEIGLEQMMQRLYRVMFCGERDPLLQVVDRRQREQYFAPGTESVTVNDRIESYEAVQELVRSAGPIRALAYASVPTRVLVDLADQVGLTLTLQQGEGPMDVVRAQSVANASDGSSCLLGFQGGSSSDAPDWNLHIMGCSDLVGALLNGGLTAQATILLWDCSEVSSLPGWVSSLTRPAKVHGRLRVRADARPVASARNGLEFEMPALLEAILPSATAVSGELADAPSEVHAPSDLIVESVVLEERMGEALGGYGHLNISLRRALAPSAEVEHFRFKVQNIKSSGAVEFRQSELVPRAVAAWPIGSHSDDWGPYLRLYAAGAEQATAHERSLWVQLRPSERELLAAVVRDLPRIVRRALPADSNSSDDKAWMVHAETLERVVSPRLGEESPSA